MKKKRFSASAIPFLIIVLFIGVHFLLTLFKNDVAVYEVKTGDVTDVITTTGIAVREEKTIRSKGDGYINYYASDLTKIYKGEMLYSLDEKGDIKEYIAETIRDNEEEEADNMQGIQTSIENFKDEYSEDKFENIYSLRQELDHSVLTLNEEYIDKTLKKVEKKYGKDAFRIIKAKDQGVISYQNDNIQVSNVEQLKDRDFEQKGYERNNLSSNERVRKGDPICRIVTSENWQIAAKLEKKEYDMIKDRNVVKLTFLKDGVSRYVEIQPKQKGNDYYVYLKLNKYMVRYINERYLDIEIALDTAQGFKVPVSSVVKKELYKIPSSYLTYGGNSSTPGIMAKEKKDENRNMKSYAIYQFKKDDEEYIYLDPDVVPKGTRLFNDSTGESMVIEEAKTVQQQGVYCVNRGYASFRPVEILKKYDENYIIADDTAYGISMYDYIVTDASTVKSDEILIK